MFDSITSLIGAYVSIVYPLLETYKILEFYYNSNSKNDMIDQLTQTINLINSKLSSLDNNNTQTFKNPTLKDYNKWLTYWIIIYLFTLFKNSILIKPIINLLPFYNFFELYFKIWLVYPIIKSNDCTPTANNNNINTRDTKVNGSYIIYKYYLSPNLTALNSHISSINIADLINLLISLYNVLITKYVPANFRNMLLINQSQQQQQQQLRSASNQQRQASASWQIPVPLQQQQQQQQQNQQTATPSSVSTLVSEIFSKSYGLFISTSQNEEPQSANILSSFVTIPSQSTDKNHISSKSLKNDSLLSNIYPKVLLTSLVSPLYTFFNDESHDGTTVSPISSSSSTSLSSSSSSTTARFIPSDSTTSVVNSRSPSNTIPQNLRNVSSRKSSQTNNHNISSNNNNSSSTTNNFKTVNRSFEEFDVVVKEDIMEPLNIEKLRENKFIDQKNKYMNDYDEDESVPLINKSINNSNSNGSNLTSSISTGSKRVGSNSSSSWFKWKNNNNNNSINLNDSNTSDHK